MKVYINSKYDYISDFIYSIPEIFQKEGKTIYEARNTIKTFDINGLTINIKYFQKPNIVNRFVYKYIRKSKAERSYQNALRILDKGVRTPEPIAYIETYKKRLFDGSYYVSIHEQVDGTMKEIYKCSKNQSKDLIRAFTSFTANIHKKGILHKDYSPGNILFKKTEDGYHFYLVDLNRMKFKKINILSSCKSFSRIYVDRDVLHFIGEEYSKKRKYNKIICQGLIQIYNWRFWKRHLTRHPNAIINFGNIKI